jgi:hypothetical protein
MGNKKGQQSILDKIYFSSHKIRPKIYRGLFGNEYYAPFRAMSYYYIKKEKIIITMRFFQLPNFVVVPSGNLNEIERILKARGISHKD